MQQAEYTTQYYDGTVPAWVKQITYRLSSTGKSVVIDIHGMMDLRSDMPGGHKRVYVSEIEFRLNPVGTINSVMHGAWGVQSRFYGSCAVHDARDALSKKDRDVLALELKSRGLDIYKDPEAVCLVRKRIQRKK